MPPGIHSELQRELEGAPLEVIAARLKQVARGPRRRGHLRLGLLDLYKLENVGVADNP